MPWKVMDVAIFVYVMAAAGACCPEGDVHGVPVQRGQRDLHQPRLRMVADAALLTSINSPHGGDGTLRGAWNPGSEDPPCGADT